MAERGIRCPFFNVNAGFIVTGINKPGNKMYHLFVIESFELLMK
jgi:hypothetical protein